MKNLINKRNNLIFFFIFLFLILQLYFFLFPRPLDFFSTGLTFFNYFNSQNFLLDNQSFYDSQHPGTPAYFFGSLLLRIFGDSISDFQKYFYASRFFILLLNIFSISIFINFFKKYLSQPEIFFFITLLVSSYAFIFSFEIVDIMAYQFSTTLLIITYFFKSLDKERKQFKLAIFLGLAVSIKISSIFLLLSVVICKILETILFKKKINKLLKFFFSISFFFLLFNLPIIGRLPAIALMTLARRDSSLMEGELLSSFQTALIQLSEQNIFLLIILTMSILVNFIIIFNFKKIINNKKEIIIFIFYILTLVSFFYTFLLSGQEYQMLRHISYLEKELIFRSSYFYLVFFLPLLFLIKKFTIPKIKNYFFIYGGLLTLIFSLYNYHSYRSEFIEDKIEKKSILIKELSKEIELKDSIIAYDNYVLGYGLNESIFFMTGNSVYSNDRFDNQIISLYPKYRYLRVADIIAGIKRGKVLFAKKKPTTKFRKLVLKYDIFIKNNLPNTIYRILSWRSYHVLPGWGRSGRSDEIFTKQNNNNVPTPDLLIYAHNNIKNTGVTHEEIKKFIEKRILIKKYLKITCKEDTWYVFIVNKSNEKKL